MNPAEPVAALQRWVDYGATYRVIELSTEHAVLQLLTCSGEPVDRLESRDPDLLRYVADRVSASVD